MKLNRIAITLCAMFLIGGPEIVLADPDGPDTWRITRLSTHDSLNIRKGPSTRFDVIGKIPFDGRDITNLGCYPNFSMHEWNQLSDRERTVAKAMTWCRIKYDNVTGWVFAMYLREDG